jgi:hypothetical protein
LGGHDCKKKFSISPSKTWKLDNDTLKERHPSHKGFWNLRLCRNPNFIRSPRGIKITKQFRCDGFVGQKIMNRASASVCKRNENAHPGLDSDPMNGYFKNMAGANCIFVRVGRKLKLKVR